MSINTAVTSGNWMFRSVDLLQLLQNLAGHDSALNHHISYSNEPLYHISLING